MKLKRLFFILVILGISGCGGKGGNSPTEVGILTGEIRSATNIPIYNAQVKIEGSSKKALTDYKGVYSISNIKIGNYKVSISKIGYQAKQESVTIKSNTSTEMNVVMTANPDTNLLKGSADITFPGINWSGEIIVSIILVDANKNEYSTQIAILEGNTSGFFVLDGIPAGQNYLLTAIAVDSAKNALTLKTLIPQLETNNALENLRIDRNTNRIAQTVEKIADNMGVSISEIDSETIDKIEEAIQKEPDFDPIEFANRISTGTVSGVVTDYDYETPISHALVSILDTDLTVESDTDGEFTIMNVPVRARTITASKDDYEPYSKSITVMAGETENCDMILTSLINPINYVLNIKTNGEGSVIKEPSRYRYPSGLAVTLTAKPEEGWSFGHWEGDVTGNTNPITITMDAEKNVTAVFTQNRYTLRLNVKGSGTVTKTPDQTTYLSGSIVRLIAKPTDGWRFNLWEGDLDSADNPVNVHLSTDMVVTAIFTQNQYNLSTTIGGSGRINKEPDQSTYLLGQIVKLTAAPEVGWTFSHWEGNVDGSENPVSVTIDGDKNIKAVFTENEYPLHTMVNGDGIIIKTLDQETYRHGSTLQLQAISNEGWGFDHWEGDVTGSENPVNITMDGEKSVTAFFTQSQYRLTINTDLGGVVTKAPDQDMYLSGSPVKLTALPADGRRFLRWEGDINGTTNPVEIQMDRDMIVTANFEYIPYGLSTKVKGDGRIDKNPDTITYQWGKTIELTAAPEVGWSFDHWEGDASGSDNPVSVTIDGDKEVTAIFIRNKYRLALNVNGNGSVTKNPDQAEYEYRDIVTLTAAPADGWVFDGWEGDKVGAQNPDQVIMDRDKNITARFIQPYYTLCITMEGQGTVITEPNQNKYLSGAVVELTALPDEGWSFDHWEYQASGSANPLNIVMDDYKNVKAVFTENKYTLNITVNGNGRVLKYPDQATYQHNDRVQLQAKPNESTWILDHWEGDLSGNANLMEVIMNQDKNITAVFTEVGYQLSIAYDGKGTVIKNPDQPGYFYEEEVELTAYPDPGWRLAYWSGSAFSVSSGFNPITIKMLTHSEATAHFEQYEKVLTWGSYGQGDGQFAGIYGIVAHEGYIYVVERQNCRVQKFDNNGNFVLKWGSKGSEDGQFLAPGAIAVDSDGNIYVSDNILGYIQKFDNNGSFVKKWQFTDRQDLYSNAMAVSPDGYLYISVVTCQIKKYDLDGNHILNWGSSGHNDGQFSTCPWGIAVDAEGNVHVADFGNYRIQIFDSNGNFITKWGSRGDENGAFQGAHYITIDSSGRVLVSDPDLFRVQIFSGEKGYISKFDVGAEGPEMITADANGNIYVVKRNTILKYSPVP